jgi:hypothetical protein
LDREINIGVVNQLEDAMMDWEFETLWALWCGLKIPFLIPFIGSEIGSTGIRVDGYGGGIMRAVRDGKWTIRHDKLKLFLWDLWRQA